MRKSLELVTGHGIRLVITATGAPAVAILARLAGLVAVPLSEPVRPGDCNCAVFSPGTLPAAASGGAAGVTAGYEIHRREDGFVLLLTPDPDPELELARVRYPLMLLMMQAACRELDCVLFHGAMLTGPDGATLLVASSGIGKSTSARRYIAAGGEAHYDDQMLLCWRQEAGRPAFFIHGLPTWSRVFRDGFAASSFPFRPAFPLHRLYCLSRGAEREEIRPLAPAVWHGHLIAAMLEHQIWPEALLDTAEKVRLGRRCWQIAEQLDRVFPPQELAAHLDYNLKHTLERADAVPAGGKA